MPAVTQPDSRVAGPASLVADGGSPPWQHVAVLSVLTTIYVAAYAFSLAIPDSTRDVYTAYQISVGQDFPLEGPVFGGAMHGGPVWFYLLAVPLVFHKSWLAVTLFVGAIAGLKFSLGYVCGSRLVDRRFGLIWALALALPGWSTIEQVAFTNVNVAETCVLAALYFAIRVWERPDLGRVFVLGIACGLAFHAHPTTLPVVPLSLGLALLAGLRHRRATVILAFSAGCATPFVPYLVSQMRQGFPDFQTGAGYLATNVQLGQIANVLAIVRSVLFDGPLLIARDLIGVSPPLLRYAEAGVIVFLLAALIAAIRSVRAARGARTLWLTGGAVASFAVVIACLRPATPVYFVYALIPPIAALVAIGVHAFTQNRLGSPIMYAFAAVVITLQALVVLKIATEMAQGVGTLPGVGDVSAGVSSEPSTNVWFPSLAHDDSGRFLCRYGDRLAVHGPMAFLVDMNVGVDTLIHCDRIPDVQLGGMGDGDRTHWVGMPRNFWVQASLSPRCWMGSLGLATAVSAVGPVNGIARAPGKAFLPRPFLRGPSRERDLSFEAPAGQALVLTNVIPWYMPWQVLSVQVDGRDLAPVAVTAISRLYATPAAPGVRVNRWDVRFAAPDPDKIDVVAVDSSARAVGKVPSCVDSG